MIDRLEIHAGEKRGNPDVVLAGAPARILADAQESKTAVSARDGGRVLMVAGAGIEPAAFGGRGLGLG